MSRGPWNFGGGPVIIKRVNVLIMAGGTDRLGSPLQCVAQEAQM